MIGSSVGEGREVAKPAIWATIFHCRTASAWGEAIASCGALARPDLSLSGAFKKVERSIALETFSKVERICRYIVISHRNCAAEYSAGNASG